MSQTIARLKRQIGSANDLQSVVRTMKAMAASNVVQYESAVDALAEYNRTVELALSVCIREAGITNVQSESAPATALNTTAAILFGSDQGLVGQFNRLIADEAERTLTRFSTKHAIWSVGERVNLRQSKTRPTLVDRFNVPSSVKAIATLVGQILIDYESYTGQHPVTQLFLFHNRPTTGSLYEPVCQRLLPLDNIWLHQHSEPSWPTKNLPQVLGSPIQTMQKLTSEYLFVTLYRACAESLASENASRLAAMQRADKNIEELLSTLRSSYHRQRQSSIDEELFDVVAGFEAFRT